MLISVAFACVDAFDDVSLCVSCYLSRSCIPFCLLTCYVNLSVHPLGPFFFVPTKPKFKNGEQTVVNAMLDVINHEREGTIIDRNLIGSVFFPSS